MFCKYQFRFKFLSDVPHKAGVFREHLNLSLMTNNIFIRNEYLEEVTVYKISSKLNNIGYGLRALERRKSLLFIIYAKVLLYHFHTIN